MKAKDVKVGDKLYKFVWDNVYSEYEYEGEYKVTKLTPSRIYLGNTKLNRKGSFPLADNLGRDPWVSAYLGEIFDKYSPDEDWNILANKQLKEKRKLDNEMDSVLDGVKELFMGSSVSDKKRILESLKDIN